MIDEKKIKEMQSLVPKLLEEGLIRKRKEYKKLVEFFRENALESLNSAKLLLEVSTNPKLMELTGFKNFRGFLWAINASYYSMFYICQALLASEGIKITAETGVHKIVFNTFVYYFYLTGKITKRFVEEFLEAQKDSQELLAREDFIQEADLKAKTLIGDLSYEGQKRKTFTYKLTNERIEVRAKTSLERAQNFFTEMCKIIRHSKE
jgi:uncharacterized protein (UPF0332 family)